MRAIDLDDETLEMSRMYRAVVARISSRQLGKLFSENLFDPLDFWFHPGVGSHLSVGDVATHTRPQEGLSK